MLKCPLILGSRGNMGRRYGAILRHLGVDFVGVDAGDELPSYFDSVLIATPTHAHLSQIRHPRWKDLPILCEKPIATSYKDVQELIDDCRRDRVRLRMVNQYEELVRHPYLGGKSRYDYWNHGKDGLAWDCINIIGMAKGAVELGETSPVWNCALNGEVLNIAEMDRAYISMVKSWLYGYHENLDYISQAHRKVEEFLCQKLS